MHTMVQLAAGRAKSLGMIRQFQRLVARFGHRVHFAVEWPRTNDGWNTAPVKALRKILNIECNFDGCQNRPGKC